VKYIRKRGAPHRYAQWCTSVAGTAKADFRELPKQEKQNLLNALIAEQGALCAYTMRRIDEGASHVEHIKPQTRCRADLLGSDLDYGNLVACYPRDGMARRCRYGAQEKGGWWENNGKPFVSPLHPVCEKRFRFDIDGQIAAVNNHEDAVMTIEVLALDHFSLTEDRKRVIGEFLFGPDGSSPLTSAQANQAAAAICEPDGHGYFREFCVAIRGALVEHLKLLNRLKQKKKAIRRRK